MGELDPFVEREVIEPFDHKYLNEEVAGISGPWCRRPKMCAAKFTGGLQRFPAARLERVRIEETSKNSFEYRSGEQPQ